MESPLPVPDLMDELVEEVLLRFPPDDPASLVRAALVCKLWRRIVSTAAFSRRYREFHRTPPLLGVLCYSSDSNSGRYKDDRPTARFIHTSSFHPAHPVRDGWRAVDARQGRVLLDCWSWGDHRPGYGRAIMTKFIVWDPVTNKQQKLPTLLTRRDYFFRRAWAAAVICNAGGSCSHRYCNWRSFMVVVLSIKHPEIVCTYIYSSKTGAWSKPTFTSIEALCLYESFKQEPGVLMGNALYFLLLNRGKIMTYDMTTRKVSVINIQPGIFLPRYIVLMTMEDGRLGFATTDGSSITLWSRVVGTDGDAGFAKCRVINLPEALDAPHSSPHVSGFAHDVGVLFIWTRNGLYSMDIKTEHVRKVPTTNYYEGVADVVPYLNFHTPAFRAAST